MKTGKLLLLIVSILYLATGNGQPLTRKKTVQPGNIAGLYADDLCNFYTLEKSGRITRYNTNGDSTGSCSFIRHGVPDHVDVTNPLRPLLYYKQFGRIVVLDNMLSVKTEINLRSLNMLNTSMAAMGADGNIWVYDQFASALYKLDIRTNSVKKTAEPGVLLGTVVHPETMLAAGRKLFMVDTTLGLLIFDEYGSYMNTVPLPGIKDLQVAGDQLTYFSGNAIHYYNFKTIAAHDIPLPVGGAAGAKVCGEHIYIRLSDAVAIFEMAR